MTTKRRLTPWMIGVGIVTFLAGLLFGYDQGVINAIIYYANEIFAEAGFTIAEQQAKATLYAVGAVNVLATLIAAAWVDRFGRRPLLLTASSG
jgi:MFS family permease